MNLVDAYIEVIKTSQKYSYDREVLDYLNRKMGTSYPKQSLHNWRSENNPRQVPKEVKAHMREVVVVSVLGELETDIGKGEARKLAGVLSDEQQMRRQMLELTLASSGVAVSTKKRKALAQSLETLYDQKML